MSNSYKLNRHCLKCNIRISDKNKSGFCNIHRDRTGKNNPFYGKKHSAQTITIIKKKISIALKKLWQNPEYRKKVIQSTSKPRRKEFGKEQSIRIMQWYKDNPIQREIRSKAMKKSWENGNIVKNGYSCNHSKLEKMLFNDIKKIAIEPKTGQTIRDINNRWLFPDILIEHSGVIIEFYGDYWHANPNKYKATDVVRRNLTATQIWKYDEERIERFQDVPCNNSKFNKVYRVLIVWEQEYKNNKKLVLQGINQLLNYEYSY